MRCRDLVRQTGEAGCAGLSADALSGNVEALQLWRGPSAGRLEYSPARIITFDTVDRECTAAGAAAEETLRGGAARLLLRVSRSVIQQNPPASRCTRSSFCC